ncbi:hypothetical protein HDF15_002900 [Granulicella mallensis]|uniref:Uncharacterized protein n=1 Tax=Granulicella mallensis TaxID=940614 RepID=A0A7W7ZRU6_9BACT|nr:hypothetical protein [Granulicella mallensis]
MMYLISYMALGTGIWLVFMQPGFHISKQERLNRRHIARRR